MKIVFFSSSAFSPLVLPYLDKSFEVELIVDEKNTDLDIVKNTEAEIAVLAAFGKIIPKEILNHFKYGILNIHPSLLPKYRGPSPVQNAIINGDRETGVTVIKLDEEMDHGPIVAQKRVEISKEDTAESLYKKLFPLGANLICQTINQYINNELNLIEQDHSKATYTKILTRQDGYFDIDNPPSPEKLDLMIRAYYFWPGAWTKWDNKILKFLPNKIVQVEGKKAISYKDFTNGYPNVDRKILSLLT